MAWQVDKLLRFESSKFDLKAHAGETPAKRELASSNSNVKAHLDA